MTLRLGRRKFGLLAGATLVSAPALVRAQPQFSADPFSLGVASGYPTPGGMVLWTRLAPDPLNGGGMGEAPVNVIWEVATDESFTRIVKQGRTLAEARLAHSVHVEVVGLQPDRPYWYRFHIGAARSPIGRTRTAPAPDTNVARLHLAFASCQQYEQGFYSAYRHMATEDLDLVVHLGDYIYELSWGQRHVRKHGTANPSTLAEYRDRYALYKSDRDLQAAHAAFPWLVVWDDHEVENDYTDGRSPNSWVSTAFLRRRADAYRAWYEHMPVPATMAPNGPAAQIYGRWRFGARAELFLVDSRQYRAHHPCSGGKGGAALLADCPERLDPNRTYLGAEQEAWLRDGLARSTAQWSVLGQQTLMSQVDRGNKEGGSSFWLDRWDGYPAARQRVLDAMAANRTASPLVIGGDVHSFWASDLKADFGRENSPTIATEFAGTSITSVGPAKDRVREILARNPHLRFGQGDKRGYATMELTEKAARVTFEAVDDVFAENSVKTRLATFAVEAGKPGVQHG